MKLRDFIRELFAKDGDPELLREGRAGSAGDQRSWLAMQRLDLTGRSLLSDFRAPEGAADRLAQRVAATETWARLVARNERAASPAPRFAKLSLDMDVVGHERIEPKPHGPKEKVDSARKSAGKNRSKRRKKKK